MAYAKTFWVLKDTGSAGWSGVTPWSASTAQIVGDFRRQLATPAVGSERCIICIVPGTTGGAEPSWVLTRGAKTTDGTVTWMECTGVGAVNGDLTNAATWALVKAATPSQLGQVIKNTAGTHLFIVTTNGNMGASEPSWNTTLGATTADGSTTWTCIGPVANFTTQFAYPFARAQTPATIGFMLAGETCYVAASHTEAQGATMTISSTSGTAAGMLKFITVDDTQPLPPTSANVVTTPSAQMATNGTFAMTLSGNVYYQGLIVNAAVGSSSQSSIATGSSGSNLAAVFETCAFNLKTTSVASGSTITLLAAQYNNCSASLNATGQRLNFANSGGSEVVWKGGSMCATGSVPTALFAPGVPGSNPRQYVRVVGADLSAITGSLVDVTNASGGYYDFIDCKLAAGVALTTGAFASGVNGMVIRIFNCDSGGTNLRYGMSAPYGTAVHETTVVRTGGASDGITPISLNFTTNASPSFEAPFRSDEISFWNDQIGSPIDLGLYFTSNSLWDDTEVYAEVQYLGNASFPIATILSGKPQWFASPNAIPSDSSTWGGSVSNKFKLSLPSFTPMMNGLIRVRLYITKRSSTLYLDAKPELLISGVPIGSAKQFMIGPYGYFNTPANSNSAAGGGSVFGSSIVKAA